MSIVKDAKGDTAEAFDLIMRKEFAWDILEGRKKAEFRNLSAFYIKRFLEPRKTLQDTLDAFEAKKGVKYIHFHDYNQSWYLDVRINEIYFLSVHPDCLDTLHSLGCHEFDDMAKEYADKPIEEIPQFFALKIYSVLGTNLTSLSDLEKSGKVKVEPVLNMGFIDPDA